MTILILTVTSWCLVSLGVSVLVGACIHYGSCNQQTRQGTP